MNKEVKERPWDTFINRALGFEISFPDGEKINHYATNIEMTKEDRFFILEEENPRGLPLNDWLTKRLQKERDEDIFKRMERDDIYINEKNAIMFTDKDGKKTYIITYVSNGKDKIFSLHLHANTNFGRETLKKILFSFKFID